MNGYVEQGIKNYLAAQLGAASLVVGDAPGEDEQDERLTVLAATIAGLPTSLHCFTSKDQKPELLAWIMVDCPTARHQAGALWYGSVDVGISTPATIPTVDEGTHRVIVAAVRALFPDIPKLTAALATAQREGDAPTITAATAALVAAQALAAALSAAVLATAGVSAGSWFMDFSVNNLDGGRWGSALRFKFCLLEQS